MTSIDEPLLLEPAAKHGVPGPVVRELMARTRPCLYLVQHGELPEPSRENTRPAARTGGLPALPDGVNRPDGHEPLVLSVDCAALPHGALDIELPAHGRLLFFTEVEYPPEQSALLHIPAGTPATERPADDIRVYEPCILYPAPGLSFDGESGGPHTRAFLDAEGDGGQEALDTFEEAVGDLAFGGRRPGVRVRLGGFSDSWDMAPDTDGLVLLAHLAGQAVDHDVFTMNLIVGTREEIAAGEYDGLVYEQQC
ncbi:DUF1963 domain-containing protein [Streptomyces sp. NPDC010273]|uniref:DUF1963 domain-containing protein n=1 Tax=Streptomyces sp. NPDC010273 TaxID=3364829 RepID=UPI0036F02283